MTLRRAVHPVLAGALMISGVALAQATQASHFTALDTMQPGLWQMREDGGEAHAMCVRDPTALFQLRSRGAGCSRFVIENAATSATVHYTCPGRGHGRTTIAVSTPRMVRIESEGIESGAPFSIEVEARRTGACTTN